MISATQEMIKALAAEVMAAPTPAEQDRRLRSAFERLADSDWPALVRACWLQNRQAAPSGDAPAPGSGPD